MFIPDVTDSCLSSNVAQYAKEAKQFEATLWTDDDSYATIPRHYLAYVGNGKFGIPIESYIDEPFYIRGKRSLDIPISYFPLIEIEPLKSSFKREYFTFKMFKLSFNMFNLYFLFSQKKEPQV